MTAGGAGGAWAATVTVAPGAVTVAAGGQDLATVTVAAGGAWADTVMVAPGAVTVAAGGQDLTTVTVAPGAVT